MSTPRPSALPTQGSTGSLNHNSPLPSAGPSSRVHSPISSRDSSPAGPFVGRNNNYSSASTTASNASRGMRSRKNSHEVSPQRLQPTSTTYGAPPNAAALQRALNGANIPDLQPAAEGARLPRMGGGSSSRETPSWPVSPRLKSPPPSSSSRRSSASRASQRKTENASSMAAPEITVLAPPNIDDSSDVDAHAAKPSARTSSAVSTLETVQESNTPVSNDPAGNERPEYFPTLEEDRPVTALHSSAQTPDEPAKSSPNKDNDKSLVADLKKLTSKSSMNSLNAKSTVAEPAERTMTVETETVSSIPQQTTSLAPGSEHRSTSHHRGVDANGSSLKVKRSTETIRPRKERKRTSKKPSSANVASSSSRADIFEESVQNAMEEVTSDGSDETFVYESNPPDTAPRKGRHHSRTPSGASVASGSGDARGGIIRSIAKALDQQRPVPKTRSMKFASSSSNYVTPDEDGEVHNGGTIRASQRNGSSIHHHLGRPSNRNMTNGPSLLDEENPLFPVGKTRTLTSGMPRAAVLAAQQLRNPSLKSNGYTLDMDDQTADDEQTPLLTGTVRTRGSRFGRQTRTRRSGPQGLSSDPSRPRPRLAKFVGCILILTTVSVLAFGVVCFLFAMSKPLNSVSVTSLKSVIATEQELMFDVIIQAVNPNLVPITITDLDVNLFAKSKYVGSDKWWREHGRRPPRQTRNLARQVRKRGIIDKDPIFISDPPAFPPSDPSNAPTMLLGQILHFDSPLSFDGSFWRRTNQSSTGSLRLSNPGNRTENGGGKRWETVLEHDFQLIVRGVLHYSIPFGGSANRVPICGYTFVKGNTGEDGTGDGGEDGRGGGGGESMVLLETADPFPGDSPCEI